MKTVNVPVQLLRDMLDNIELLSMMGGSTDTLDEQAERMRRLLGVADADHVTGDVRPEVRVYQFPSPVSLPGG